MEKIRESYTLFCHILLKKRFDHYEFEDAYSIPFEDPENIIYKEKIAAYEELKQSIEERYPRIKDYISAVKSANPRKITLEKEVYGHIKQFILQTLLSMKKRLPFHHEMLNKSLAVYLKSPFQAQVWRELAKSFPNIITIENEIHFAEELDSFGLQYKSILQTHNDSSLSIIKRWEILAASYPYIASLSKALLVLPYSSSPVESIFSEFKAFKTCYRNKINVESLEASILIKQEIKSKEITITPEIIEKYFKLWDKPETHYNIVKPQTNLASEKAQADDQKEEILSSKPFERQSQESEFSTFLQSLLPALFTQWQSIGKNSQEVCDDVLDVDCLPIQIGKRKRQVPLEPEVTKKVRSYSEESQISEFNEK